MLKHPGPAPFIVSVHGGFNEDGVWFIDARLRFPGRRKVVGALFGRGLHALLEAIYREERRGREQGALWVRVHLEAGKLVKDFPVEDVLPDFDSFF